MLGMIVIILTMTVTTLPQMNPGALEVNVKNVQVEGKRAMLSRKRFYLFRGGLADNAALISRIKSAEITSRNCYYRGLQASDQYICWLQAENCESPYCRVVEPRYLDLNTKHAVPEFLTAYNKGLTLFNGKTDIAREWILTNMPDSLVSGYYISQQKVLANVLSGVTPFASSMTDTAGIKTFFIDIPFAATQNKTRYLVSNVLPIEIGDKSYVWTCEKDVEAGKKVTLDLSKAGKNCEISVRTINVCRAVACELK